MPKLATSWIYLKDPFYERMRRVEKPLIAAMTGHLQQAVWCFA